MPPAERQQRARDRVEEEQLTGGPRANHWRRQRRAGQSSQSSEREHRREHYGDGDPQMGPRAIRTCEQ